ncbi:MAG: HAD domain-containing protein [Galactobacter sp.]
MTTLLVLDVDGVLNSVHATAIHPAPEAELTTSHVGRWPVRWNPATMMALRPLLEREDVTGAWCTTWLSDPHLLDGFETTLKLDGLVPLRAEYPLVQPTPDRLELNPLFDADVSLEPSQHSWWKLRAVLALVEQSQADRLIWVDDDLPRSVVGNGLENAAREIDFDGPIPRHLLVSPPREVGLRYGDVAAMRGWLSRTLPTYGSPCTERPAPQAASRSRPD